MTKRSDAEGSSPWVCKLPRAEMRERGGGEGVNQEPQSSPRKEPLFGG